MLAIPEGCAPEGVFLKSSTHPRAYGNFARLLGHYVRHEKLVPLAEAVRRLTAVPAANLGIGDRGSLKPGFFADLAIFDPQAIRDLATFERPQVYSTGMRHVFVNGVQVLKNGEHTGATPGRAVAGTRLEEVSLKVRLAGQGQAGRQPTPTAPQS